MHVSLCIIILFNCIAGEVYGSNHVDINHSVSHGKDTAHNTNDVTKNEVQPRKVPGAHGAIPIEALTNKPQDVSHSQDTSKVVDVKNTIHLGLNGVLERLVAAKTKQERMVPQTNVNDYMQAVKGTYKNVPDGILLIYAAKFINEQPYGFAVLGGRPYTPEEFAGKTYEWQLPNDFQAWQNLQKGLSVLNEIYADKANNHLKLGNIAEIEKFMDASVDTYVAELTKIFPDVPDVIKKSYVEMFFNDNQQYEKKWQGLFVTDDKDRPIKIRVANIIKEPEFGINEKSGELNIDSLTLSNKLYLTMKAIQDACTSLEIPRSLQLDTPDVKAAEPASNSLSLKDTPKKEESHEDVASTSTKAPATHQDEESKVDVASANVTVDPAPEPVTKPYVSKIPTFSSEDLYAGDVDTLINTVVSDRKQLMSLGLLNQWLTWVTPVEIPKSDSNNSLAEKIIAKYKKGDKSTQAEYIALQKDIYALKDALNVKSTSGDASIVNLRKEIKNNTTLKNNVTNLLEHAKSAAKSMNDEVVANKVADFMKNGSVPSNGVLIANAVDGLAKDLETIQTKKSQLKQPQNSVEIALVQQSDEIYKKIQKILTDAQAEADTLKKETPKLSITELLTTAEDRLEVAKFDKDKKPVWEQVVGKFRVESGMFDAANKKIDEFIQKNKENPAQAALQELLGKLEMPAERKQVQELLDGVDGTSQSIDKILVELKRINKSFTELQFYTEIFNLLKIKLKKNEEIKQKVEDIVDELRRETIRPQALNNALQEIKKPNMNLRKVIKDFNKSLKDNKAQLKAEKDVYQISFNDTSKEVFQGVLEALQAKFDKSSTGQLNTHADEMISSLKEGQNLQAVTELGKMLVYTPGAAFESAVETHAQMRDAIADYFGGDHNKADKFLYPLEIAFIGIIVALGKAIQQIEANQSYTDKEKKHLKSEAAQAAACDKAKVIATEMIKSDDDSSATGDLKALGLSMFLSGMDPNGRKCPVNLDNSSSNMDNFNKKLDSLEDPKALEAWRKEQKERDEYKGILPAYLDVHWYQEQASSILADQLRDFMITILRDFTATFHLSDEALIDLYTKDAVQATFETLIKKSIDDAKTQWFDKYSVARFNPWLVQVENDLSAAFKNIGIVHADSDERQPLPVKDLEGSSQVAGG